jgi:hypothetical protein
MADWVNGCLTKTFCDFKALAWFAAGAAGQALQSTPWTVGFYGAEDQLP